MHHETIVNRKSNLPTECLSISNHLQSDIQQFKIYEIIREKLRYMSIRSLFMQMNVDVDKPEITFEMNDVRVNE